jgi:FAD/FMN-containing dehydrogenase
VNAADAAHARRVEALAGELARGHGPIGLGGKATSNLFRDREPSQRRRLDVHGLTNVLRVDAAAGSVEAEGMVTYEALVDACLAHGVMPAVVPQLKTITLGGAVAGVGIESSSHRHGLVHETVEELEVLTGDGRVLVCTAGNEHADLFFGFPNSYGTLGYAMRVKARAIPVKKYVRLEHMPFTEPAVFFDALASICAKDEASFVDGVVFSPRKLVLTLGRFTDEAPYTSDYTYERIYYRSIAERREDFLTTHDYLWRWDTDWFWCSKNLLAQNPLVRRLYGRERLNSRTYTKIMRWNSRVGLTRRIDRLLGKHSESVIQDVDIPIARAPEFLDFFAREIGIWPAWICPIGATERSRRFSLYAMHPGLHVNFGFWDVKRTAEAHSPGHFNRLIEESVSRLGGVKSLYSDSYFTREAFDARYGGAAYRNLKAKYDPAGAFPTLYEKCVLRH